MPWLDEARLDDVSALQALDTRDSLRSLASAGAQVRRAVVAAQEAGAARAAQGERPRSVLVAALGGSAVVGDVLDLLAEPGSPVPLSCRRDAPLPGWVGPLDLVIAVSQSGRAAGPLALAAEAARRGASVLTVGAAGSPLADVCARAHGIHVDVAIPAPSSRTALWSLLTPVLFAADAMGLIHCAPDVLDRVAAVLDEVAEECRPSSEAFVNPAKVLATGLAATVPVVLGDGPLTGVAAGRAASMLARTARVPATHGSLPDAAAQVVACLDGPPTPRLGLLALRDPGLDPRGVSLANAVIGAARDAGVTVWEQEARPGEPIVRLASLIALTDFAATYLAIGLGLDPSVSRHVTDLRDRTS